MSLKIERALEEPMFGKLFLKEWREKINIFIFALIAILLFLLVFLTNSNERELRELSASAMILIFLPFVALLLGSSGFYAEFRDDAWAYLFSRPVKKWKIWIIKYFSLLAILFSILLIFVLAMQITPGLKEIVRSLTFPTGFERDISFFTLGLLLNLFFFTIAFSISFMSEKQFIIIFASILIGLGLTFVLYEHLYFLQLFYPYRLGLKGIFPFVALSFISASILTFMKSDFSQMRKKISFFSKLGALFLIISIGLSTAWTMASGSFIGSREVIYNLHTFEGDAYFSTYKGIFRYLPSVDKVEKIEKSKLTFPLISIGGGKILFSNYKGWREDTQELWVMNTDGSQGKCLICNSHKKDSLLNNFHLYSFLISPDGKKVAFLGLPLKKIARSSWPNLFWMNSDGTGLRSMPLDFSKINNFRYAAWTEIVAWAEFGNNLVILLRPRSGSTAFTKILMFSPENETYKILAENITGPWRLPVSEGQDFLAFFYRSESEEKKILTLLNLKSLEKKEISRDDLIKPGKIKWSKNGEKIVFLSEKNKSEFHLVVYSLSRQKIINTKELNQDKSFPFITRMDWVFNDQKLALGSVTSGKGYLKVLDKDLNEEKRIDIPFPAKYPLDVWGLNNIALIIDYDKGELWRVNLETEEWRKIYEN